MTDGAEPQGARRGVEGFERERAMKGLSSATAGRWGCRLRARFFGHGRGDTPGRYGACQGREGRRLCDAKKSPVPPGRSTPGASFGKPDRIGRAGGPSARHPWRSPRNALERGLSERAGPERLVHRRPTKARRRGSSARGLGPACFRASPSFFGGAPGPAAQAPGETFAIVDPLGRNEGNSSPGASANTRSTSPLVTERKDGRSPVSSRPPRALGLVFQRRGGPGPAGAASTPKGLGRRPVAHPLVAKNPAGQPGGRACQPLAISTPPPSAFLDHLAVGGADGPCGSALQILARYAEGAADLYPRLSPTSEWDTAAGHANRGGPPGGPGDGRPSGGAPAFTEAGSTVSRVPGISSPGGDPGAPRSPRTAVSERIGGAGWAREL